MGTLSVRNILFLCFAVAVYSASGLFTKLASKYDFLSCPYLLCLGGVVLVLGTYAILWQMALKEVPLNKAYLFRSLGVVYGLASAFFAFHESITWGNLIGGGIVLGGLFVLMTEKSAGRSI
jgi:drug/metabolite transporter (DMT)-like permease